jgi:hypothetical protein
LLIQYIRSYHPYLQDVSSFRNLRKGHTVVKRDPPDNIKTELREIGWDGMGCDGMDWINLAQDKDQ